MSIEGKFFYANSLEVAVSPFDISMKFMRNGTETAQKPAATSEINPNAAISVLDAMTVSMSPSHAKAMVPALLRLVQEYEKQFGRIPLGADIQATWDATFPGRDV